MRGTKRFERRITTPYFKIGTLKKASGTGSVTLSSNAGVPFETLKIKGVTVQELPNRADEYFSEYKSASAYVPAGVMGTYAIALPSEFVGKNLTYTLKKAGALGGVLLYLSDGESALFSNLTPLCNSSGGIYRVSGNTFTHLVFTNVYTSDKEDEDGTVSEVRDGIIDFWQSCDLVVTAEISPDFDTPVVCVGDKSVQFSCDFAGDFGTSRRTIYIPQYIMHQNAKLTLQLSEYDELEIRARQKQVIYRDGTFRVELSGFEPWQIYSPAASSGLGLFAYFNTSVPFTEGYCRYLDFASWPPKSSQKNIFSAITGTTNLAIKLERNETGASYYQQALNEITAFLKERYNSGVSATVIARRKIKKEYDISNTSLGQALLSFYVPYGSDGKFSAVGYALNPKLEIEYYSLDEGDSAALTVICQNELGEEILRAEHTLRLGSAYNLTAPEIEGYEPRQNELWGALKEDRTIIIEYKEKE